jgi:hypothetical protein
MSIRYNNVTTGARSGDRNRPTPGPAVSAGPIMAAFPQPLPARVSRLVDGVNIVGIQVLYSKYGMTVSVVKADKEVVPLEQYEADAKASAIKKVADERYRLYATRVAERGLDIEVPRFTCQSEADAWITQVRQDTPDVHKLVVMTNRSFRAQQGTNTDKAV